MGIPQRPPAFFSEAAETRVEKKLIREAGRERTTLNDLALRTDN